MRKRALLEGAPAAAPSSDSCTTAANVAMLQQPEGPQATFDFLLDLSECIAGLVWHLLTFIEATRDHFTHVEFARSLLCMRVHTQSSCLPTKCPDNNTQQCECILTRMNPYRIWHLWDDLIQ
jgi:hypothetical protein